MFTAYSESKKAMVNVEGEYDLEEIFSCPNPNCHAKLKIKSPYGKLRKHFALHKSKHILGCPYVLGDAKYLSTSHQVRSSLENIYSGEKMPDPGTSTSPRTMTPNDSSASQTTYIRTPKQLYNFCIVNELDAKYRDGLTVTNIVLDSRNLATSHCLEGFDGLRLVVADTVRYEGNDKLYLEIRSKGPHETPIWLNIVVTMDTGLLWRLS